ncbi:MAG: ABC transporter substrate-binding protein [Clostridia bacterium]|nr:ABC transporter substrate-binding protein [Clostridia bacterium]
MKKMLSLILALLMVFSLLGTVHAENYDQVVFSYATFNNIPTAEDLAVVEEAINVITREKIHAEIKLKPIVIWDYSSQISLMLQGGDQIDVFESLGDFNVCVTTGMARDLTDMLATDAKEACELVGDDWLAACSQKGRIYGIPTLKPIALTPMVIYRQDIVDELGLDMSQVNSPFDLTEIFRKVKAGRPDITPLSAVNTGNIGLGLTVPHVDYLSDDYYSPKGVLMNGEMTVVDFYASEEFRKACELARTWYNEDLVMKDAATTSSTAAELRNSGKYFASIASYSYPEADTAASLELQSNGIKLGAKIIGSAFLDTTSVNALSWMISSTSKVPEAALKFLNLTYCDPDIINLVIYGIEGRDYVKNDDGTVRYPDGFDAASVPYTAQLSCGTFGNFFLMYPMEGTSIESLAWEQEQNKNAETSAAMGFTFDNKRVKTQYTAVSNVIEQYLAGLICGAVDPETEIPIFLQRLSDAGLGDIIAAKQAQLNEWLAAQGK